MSNETLKTKFSDLLALADDIEADFKSVRVLRGVPARKAANASAAMGLDNRNSRKTTKKVVQETSGSSDSSDDEEIKPRPKKRKKALPVEEDSD